MLISAVMSDPFFGFVSGLIVALVVFPMAFSWASSAKASGAASSAVTTTNSVGGKVTVTTTFAGGAAWLPFVMSGVQSVLALAKDVVFIILSRRKLCHSYRELVVCGVSLARPPPENLES